METSIFHFFDQRITDCCQKQKRMKEEGYSDEANFEKIRANVYDIFKTVLSAAMKEYGGDLPQAFKFFRERLEQIPSGWAVSYEKAKEHDDVRTMHIESIKLETVQDIKENIFPGGREDK